VKWYASAPLTVLWAIILGDMIAALIAARRCYAKRKEARIAWAIMLLLITLAAESMNQIVNGVIHAGEYQPPLSVVIQAAIGRAVKAVGTWWLALKLLDD
jgi:hypothetical protein